MQKKKRFNKPRHEEGEMSPYVKVKQIEKKFNVFAIVFNDEYAEIFADELTNTLTWIESTYYKTQKIVGLAKYYIERPIVCAKFLYELCKDIRIDFNDTNIDNYKDDIRPAPFTPTFSVGSPGPTDCYELKEHFMDPDIVEQYITKKYNNILMQITIGNKPEIIDAITEFLHEDCSPAWMNHPRFISWNESTRLLEKKRHVMILFSEYCL